MKCFLFFSALFLTLSSAYAEIIDRQGKGFLETNQGALVLHLKGSPYERGQQHGKLLKEQIQQNISAFLEGPKSALHSDRATRFKQQLPELIAHTPKTLMEEMQGIADGSGCAFEKVLLLNLFPELFHCSAIVAADEATKDGALYHVRVLDYAVGKGLQKTAVLMVERPDDGIPFLNVTYAGFVGSVTGMNAHKIAVGEIGGQGYGSWDGIPMAFLMRQILERSSNLEDAKDILLSSPRTCEYFYIISDGNQNTSIGAYATKEQIKWIERGSLCAFLAIGAQTTGTECGCSCSTEQTPHQTILYRSDRSIAALLQQQPHHCLLLTGLTHPERYPILADRLLKHSGSIDEKILQQVIKGPAGKLSNLHNAIFLPQQLKVWIAHAGTNDEPAYTQPYTEFSLDLFLRAE